MLTKFKSQQRRNGEVHVVRNILHEELQAKVISASPFIFNYFAS